MSRITLGSVIDRLWRSDTCNNVFTLGIDKIFTIEGGIVVPFYVFAFAILGAGINMIRRLPLIQRRYHSDGLVPNATFAWEMLERVLNPFARGAELPKETQEHASIIRAELIHNYMYLLAAPFLAITIYYLLSMIAAEVTQPVLVVRFEARTSERLQEIQNLVINKLKDFGNIRF